MNHADDKVVMEFPVLWLAWECDATAWVMERANGTRYLRMTNHGSAYVAAVETLQERLAEYKRVASATRDALKLLEGEEAR